MRLSVSTALLLWSSVGLAAPPFVDGANVAAPLGLFLPLNPPTQAAQMAALGDLAPSVTVIPLQPNDKMKAGGHTQIPEASVPLLYPVGASGMGPCIGLIVRDGTTIYAFHFTATENPTATLDAVIGNPAAGTVAAIAGGNGSASSNRTLARVVSWLNDKGVTIDGYFDYVGLGVWRNCQGQWEYVAYPTHNSNSGLSAAPGNPSDPNGSQGSVRATLVATGEPDATSNGMCSPHKVRVTLLDHAGAATNAPYDIDFDVLVTEGDGSVFKNAACTVGAFGTQAMSAGTGALDFWYRPEFPSSAGPYERLVVSAISTAPPGCWGADSALPDVFVPTLELRPEPETTLVNPPLCIEWQATLRDPDGDAVAMGPTTTVDPQVDFTGVFFYGTTDTFCNNAIGDFVIDASMTSKTFHVKTFGVGGPVTITADLSHDFWKVQSWSYDSIAEDGPADIGLTVDGQDTGPLTYVRGSTIAVSWWASDSYVMDCNAVHSPPGWPANPSAPIPPHPESIDNEQWGDADRVLSISGRHEVILVCDAAGRRSKILLIEIDVIDPPTATISAAPATIPDEGAATITWSSTDTVECDVRDDSWLTLATGLSGSAATGALHDDVTYTVECYDALGNYVSDSATVTVLPPPPPTVSISNGGAAPYGGSTTITWSSSGATDCWVYEVSWTDSFNGTGGTETTAELWADTTYVAECTNSDGVTASASTAVTVVMPPTPTATITAAVDELAGEVTATWSSTDAVECWLWSSSGDAASGTSGSLSFGLPPWEETYAVDCADEAYLEWVTASVTIAGSPVEAALMCSEP